jgi:deoxyhypusine monooxygenase
LLSGTPKPDGVSAAVVDVLQKDLINKSLPLFQRYRAMFALRNIGTPAAVDALAAGFSDDSALFKYLIYSHKSTTNSFNRHEIAFVFGQLLSPHSVPALLKVLQNANESDMVRHEAAEALGDTRGATVYPRVDGKKRRCSRCRPRRLSGCN